MIFNLEYLTVTKIGLKCRTDKAALRKDENKVDRDLSYGELQQLLIDTYREGHFKTIEYTEKLLEQYKSKKDKSKNDSGKNTPKTDKSQSKIDVKTTTTNTTLISSPVLPAPTTLEV